MARPITWLQEAQELMKELEDIYHRITYLGDGPDHEFDDDSYTQIEDQLEEAENALEPIFR